MSGDYFYDLLGDDGEFKEPVDHRYGVYSLHRRGYWWRCVMMVIVGLFVSAIIAVAIFYF